jgi:glycosyltransferase involved in cell wall biosynthesis
MRIYQLGKNWFSEASGGGSDRVFTALHAHLPSGGSQVHGVVVGPVPSNGSAVPGAVGLSSDDAPLPSRWMALRRHVRRTLPAFNADVVTSHFALYTLPVLRAVRDYPFVVHFHGPWAMESAMEGEGALKTSLKSRVERAVYQRGDRFIVLSPAFRDILVREYGVDSSRVCIVPGGVDVEAYDTGLSQDAARERLGWPTDRPILLSVRRLVKRVGLEGLIDAMRDIRRQVPDVLLYVAGKGPLRAELEARVDAHGLEDHVRFLGFVPESDLAATYCAADLSVMPTVALEGFGLSAVESLAAGTPVLVTPVGGLPTIVDRLSDTLIFADRTAGAVADRLAAVLTGSVEVPDSRTCRDYAATHFDWPVIAEQTRRVYQTAMQ